MQRTRLVTLYWQYSLLAAVKTSLQPSHVHAPPYSNSCAVSPAVDIRRYVTVADANALSALIALTTMLLLSPTGIVTDCQASLLHQAHHSATSMLLPALPKLTCHCQPGFCLPGGDT